MHMDEVATATIDEPRLQILYMSQDAQNLQPKIDGALV